jgi:dihydroxy-acid dehydratase
VHLAAVAREAGETGFGQVIRVLTPESPALVSASLLGARALLASLGDALHDVPTVTGPLKEALPLAPEALPEPATQLRFVRGRASGIEALASAPPETAEFSGTCRLFRLESRAVRAVERGSVEPGDLILVPGCGPRGGPGLLRLDRLGEALRGAGLETPVLTDGLPPAGEAAEPTGAPWVSLFTPEAATGGVIARLRDGDFLRIVLKDGVIRTSINAEDFALREAPYRPTPTGAGYATRYATSAAAALEGAGFGPDDR